MFTTDFRLMLPSVSNTVTGTIYGDAHIHTEDADVRVVLHARDFNVLFQAECKVAVSVE